MTINELADKVLKENDDILARAFTLCIGKLLAENGIVPIIRKVEDPEQLESDKNAYIIRKKYNITFDGLDCTEHDKRISAWIPVSERLPRPEEEVLVTVIRRYVDGDCRYIVIPAIYEDGTVLECDSNWNWEDIDGDWDEENDCLIIPEGWFEDRKYNPEWTYNCAIDDEVVAWMPLPEPYRESEPYKQTNADRICSMTDEELANVIMCPAEFTGSDKVCDFSQDCKDCTLAWLQRESEGI